MDFKEMELNAQVTSSDIFVLRLLSLVFQISWKNGLINIIFLLSRWVYERNTPL